MTAFRPLALLILHNTSLESTLPRQPGVTPPSGISLLAGTAVAQTLAPEGLSIYFAVSPLRERLPGSRRGETAPGPN